MPPRACDTDEAEIGLRHYLSASEGSGGRIKVQPEDFWVEEISDHPPRDEEGRYSIATVRTNNWETNRLIRLLSRQMGVSRNRVGFAGTKDKRAVTSQLMSFDGPPEMLDKVDLKDVEIFDVYRARRPIRIGELIGNRFRVTVRDCDLSADALEESLADTAATLRAAGGFPNFFGVQRFGALRPVTHKVGERIVRGDLAGAVRCYLSETSPHEGEDMGALRQELEDESALPSLLAKMPRVMSYERTLAEHLVRNPGDYAGAIGALPGNLQMMFVHAYQSYLFNLMLSERMRREIPLNEPREGDLVIPLGDKGVPLPEQAQPVNAANLDLVARQTRRGRAFVTASLFGSESVLADGEMGEIEREVIAAEGLKREDFIIPALPHCSSKGSRREMLCSFNDLEVEISGNSYTLSFSLPKGNYATCLLREFMKSEMSCY